MATITVTRSPDRQLGTSRMWVVGILLPMLALGCTEAPATANCPPEALATLELLGNQMRRVSVLGPGSTVGRELEGEYGNLVADSLLTRWRNDPRSAPGRAVSNPWPQRIEVDTARMVGGSCRVSGAVVYVTTADTSRVVERRPVVVELRRAEQWKVTAWSLASPADVDVKPARPELPARASSGSQSEAKAESESAADDPAAVVRAYYAAIDARRYGEAYRLWARGGQASGKDLDAFTRGFADTRSVRVSVTDSTRMEGAAGSQYATVPVAIDAVMTDGRAQRFVGTYTLRRSMVDGATAEQREWRIYSATIAPELRSGQRRPPSI